MFDNLFNCGITGDLLEILKMIAKTLEDITKKVGNIEERLDIIEKKRK